MADAPESSERPAPQRKNMQRRCNFYRSGLPVSQRRPGMGH